MMASVSVRMECGTHGEITVPASAILVLNDPVLDEYEIVTPCPAGDHEASDRVTAESAARVLRAGARLGVP